MGLKSGRRREGCTQFSFNWKLEPCRNWKKIKEIKVDMKFSYEGGGGGHSLIRSL